MERKNITIFIVLEYMVFGFLWILFSDRILEALLRNKDLLSFMQTIKGWVFIIITSMLLYFWVKKASKESDYWNERLIEVNSFYKKYFDEAFIGFVRMDRSGEIKDINKIAEKILDCEKIEDEELKWDEIGVDITSDLIVERTLESEDFKFDEERMLVNFKGEVTYIQIIARSLKDTEDFIISIHDITDKKENENKLKELNVGLEKEVKIRTEDLNKTNEYLEETLSRNQEIQAELIDTNEKLMDKISELERAKEKLIDSEKMAELGNLVAGIAHEINTPIGISVTAASYLESEREGIEKLYNSGAMRKTDFEDYMRRQAESLKLVLKNLQRSSEIIKSFKEVSADRTHIVKRKFELSEYLKEIIMSLHPIIKKTNHVCELKVDKEIKMNSYPGAIAQVISNLFTNTVNHGFDKNMNGIITIEANLEDNMAVIDYYDNGKGIPKENLSKIFEPFFTTKKESGGTGLGLSIVKNLVEEKLEGTIECMSSEEEGTRFKIKIPVKIEEKNEDTLN